MIVSAAQPTETGQFLAESGHFYHPDGRPAYTVKMASGKGRRKTTLRDAKKLGLFPSVTTILGTLDKPGLNIWMQRQIVEHADDVKREHGESVDAYIRRIMEIARQKGKTAAERGTRIHAILEQHAAGEAGLMPTRDEKMMVAAVDGYLQELDPEMRWKVEESVACPQHKYAGKIDILNDDLEIVLDYKTKEFGPDSLPKGYPEQAMQLAAYGAARGYKDPTLINVFVSVTHPGLIHPVIHADPQRWARAFQTLADYWWIVKGNQ